MSETTKISSSVVTAEAATKAEMVPITSLPSETVITHSEEDHLAGIPGSTFNTTPTISRISISWL
jgi:hypothetical protein